MRNRTALRRRGIGDDGPLAVRTLASAPERKVLRLRTGRIAEVSISIGVFWATETVDTSTPPIAIASTPVSAEPSQEDPVNTFASFYFTMTQAG